MKKSPQYDILIANLCTLADGFLVAQVDQTWSLYATKNPKKMIQLAPQLKSTLSTGKNFLLKQKLVRRFLWYWNNRNEHGQSPKKLFRRVVQFTFITTPPESKLLFEKETLITEELDIQKPYFIFPDKGRYSGKIVGSITERDIEKKEMTIKIQVIGSERIGKRRIPELKYELGKENWKFISETKKH